MCKDTLHQLIVAAMSMSLLSLNANVLRPVPLLLVKCKITIRTVPHSNYK